MKTCQNCGAQLADDAVFCTTCGAASPVAPAMNAPAMNAPVVEAAPNFNAYAPMDAVSNTGKSKKKLFLFGGIGLAVIAVIVALLLVFLGGGGKGGNASPEKAVTAFWSAFNDRDAEGILVAVLPDQDKVWEATEKEEDLTRDDFVDTFQELIDMYDGLFGDDWKINFEIKDTEFLDKEDYEDFQDDFKEEFGLKITDAAEVEVEITLLVDGDETTTDSQTMQCYKCDGKWYVSEDLF